jgi:hypothetical protein
MHMSVVPLILDKSIVDTQNAFQSGGGVYGHALLVLSLERSQLLSTKSSNVSYDMRVGSKYRGYRDPNDTDLGLGKEILLRAGDAVLIQTEETLHVPQSLFGYVVPKVGLLQSGLSNTLSKEPLKYSPVHSPWG